MESSQGDSWFETKVGVPAYPSDMVAYTHLYWLMHLGLQDAMDRIRNQQEPVRDDAAPSDVLLLGSIEEVGKGIIQAQGLAHEQQVEQTRSDLRELLPIV